MKNRDRRVGRSGTSAVELALVLPLIVSMLLGLWEVGRLAQVRQFMMNAAREGGRQASTSQLSSAQVRQVVLDYLNGVKLPTQNAAVTVKNLTNPGTDAIDAAQLDCLEVTVSMPSKDVRLVTGTSMTGAGTTLNAKSTWYSMKDKPYPAPPEPPIE